MTKRSHSHGDCSDMALPRMKYRFLATKLLKIINDQESKGGTSDIMESGGSNPGSSHSERHITSLPAWAEYKSPRHLVSVTRTVPSIEKAVMHRDDIYLQGLASTRQAKRTGVVTSPDLSPRLYRKGLVPPLNLAALSESRNSSRAKNYNRNSHTSSPEGQESSREWDLTPRGVGPGQGFSQANLSQEILARLQEASISRSPPLLRRHPRALGTSRVPNNNDLIASGHGNSVPGNAHHGPAKQHGGAHAGNTYPASSVPSNSYPGNSGVTGITSPDYIWSFQGMHRQGLRESAAAPSGGASVQISRKGPHHSEAYHSRSHRIEEGGGGGTGAGVARGGGGGDEEEDWVGGIQGFSPRGVPTDVEMSSDEDRHELDLEMVRRVNSPSTMNSSVCHLPRIHAGRLNALVRGGRDVQEMPVVVGIGRKRQPEEPVGVLAREERKEPKQARGPSLVIKLPSVNDNYDKR